MEKLQLEYPRELGIQNWPEPGQNTAPAQPKLHVNSISHKEKAVQQTDNNTTRLLNKQLLAEQLLNVDSVQ